MYASGKENPHVCVGDEKLSTLKVRLFSIFFWDRHEYKEVWDATCLSQEITPRSVFASYDISGQSSINCVSSVQRNARFRPCPTAEPYVGYYIYPNSAGVVVVVVAYKLFVKCCF